MEQYEIIAQLRKNSKLSIRKLSELTGISRSLLSALELGKSNGSIETLQKLADFYGCTLDYITGRDERRTVIYDLLEYFEDVKGWDLDDPEVQQRILDMVAEELKKPEYH